jgi:hypothetical protein
MAGMSNDADALEMFIHYAGIPHGQICPDIVTGSLETINLIPIISEPAR